MLNTIFAKKLGMEQRFATDGKRLGVTLLSVFPVSVSGFKTVEKHGYTAAILKYGTNLHEVRGDFTGLEIGSEIKPEDFLISGDKVSVTGISKGKGFSGVVKKYHFSGGPRTHGQSNRERSRGSSGSGTTPGRVNKGKRMAGRMGGETITEKRIKVVDYNAENKTLVLNGSIPGFKRGMVRITKK